MMRLTRQQSMTRAFQFAQVRREGTSTAGRLIVLSAFALPGPKEHSRFGIICTKKVARRAVDRNKLKRRIRELLRKHAAPFSRGVHLVCVLRWRALEASFEELEKDFVKTSKRLLRDMPSSGKNNEIL